MRSAATRLGDRRFAWVVLLGGLAFRIWLLRLTSNAGGDGGTYELLAYHLWAQHCFSLSDACAPTMIRPPGYPALIALIYSTFGRSVSAVWLFQALIDTCSSAVVFATARLLVAPRVARLALVLAAFCPFTAVYSGYLLSETATTLLAALCTLGMAQAVDQNGSKAPLLVGLSAGLAALFRPEMLIFGVLAAGWLAARKRARAAILVAGLALFPSAFWAGRNWVVMGRVGLAETGGVEGVQPDGYFAWVRTWHSQLAEREGGVWPYWTSSWAAFRFPEAAFENNEERLRVFRLLEAAAVAKTDAERRLIEQGFHSLAKERSNRRPFRTYVVLPMVRAWNLWATSRTEAFPLPSMADVRSLSTTTVVKLALAVSSVTLVAGAFVGAMSLVGTPAGTVLLMPLAFRTAFFSLWAGMEARYMLPAFPALLVLAAFGLSRTFAAVRAIPWRDPRVE